MSGYLTIYFKAALFRCKCCNYETEIYFNAEYLVEGCDDLCECNRKGHYKFSSIYISRDDLDGIVLHGQFASLPDDKNKCLSCLGVSQVSWKEVVTVCIKCEASAMYFAKDVVGKNIHQYGDWCRDWVKPAHPCLIFKDEDGSEIIALNGLLSNISSS